MNHHKNSPQGQEPQNSHESFTQKHTTQPFYEEFASVDQAAGFLKYKKSTIYKLVNQGKLAAFKVGKMLQFRYEDLDRYRKAKYLPTDDELSQKANHFAQNLNKEQNG